jgi:hypothetical protein
MIALGTSHVPYTRVYLLTQRSAAVAGYDSPADAVRSADCAYYLEAPAASQLQYFFGLRSRHQLGGSFSLTHLDFAIHHNFEWRLTTWLIFEGAHPQEHNNRHAMALSGAGDFPGGLHRN